MTRDGFGRRRLLRRLGGAFGGVATLRTGTDERTRTRRVAVGYDSRRARRATEDATVRTHQRYAFGASVVSASAGELAALAEQPSVRYVEPIRPVYLKSEPLNRGVDRIDADVAQAHGESADGTDVAILDTGIDRQHEALRSSLGDGKAFVRAGFWHLTPWDDDNQHGTHCAGVVGARTDDGGTGVSVDASLHAVKVLDGKGAGTTEDVAAGIEYVADQGWDVANLSLGTSKSKLIEDAVEHAEEAGVLLVAATSRDHPYPAAEPECLAVAATDSSDDPATFAPGSGRPDLLAPGVAIRSTVPGGFDTLSGNSVASAHVSGAAAQLVADGHSAESARETLLESAEDLGFEERVQGAGLLDVAAALGYDSTDDVPARNKRRARESQDD
jgi:subtilisin